MNNFLSRKPVPILGQVEDYLRWCEFKARMTPSTMKSKKQSINKFIAEHPKLSDLRRLTNRELDDWCTSMVAAGKTGKTVNGYADHVTGCLRFLQNKRGEKLALRLEAIDRVDEDEVDVPYFTEAEIKKIKKACSGLRDLLLVSLIFESALRIHEVAKLQVENIEGQMIRIRGKGRKLRTTFILPATHELLDRWLLLAGINQGYVFPSPTKFDAPLSAQQIRWSINSPIRRAGFETGSAHALRRSAITAALDHGLSLQDTAKWAGHSDPRTTLKHYYKVTAEQLGKRHAKALTAAVSGR